MGKWAVAMGKEGAVGKGAVVMGGRLEVGEVALFYMVIILISLK